VGERRSRVMMLAVRWQQVVEMCGNSTNGEHREKSGGEENCTPRYARRRFPPAARHPHVAKKTTPRMSPRGNMPCPGSLWPIWSTSSRGRYSRNAEGWFCRLKRHGAFIPNAAGRCLRRRTPSLQKSATKGRCPGRTCRWQRELLRGCRQRPPAGRERNKVRSRRVKIARGKTRQVR